MSFIANFIYLLSTVLTFAIFGRVLMSWISPRGNDSVSNFLFNITEPILAPIRRLLPKTGMFDFSPMIVLLVLQLVIPRLLKIFI